MMTNLTRRIFLRQLTAVGFSASGAILLAACGQPQVDKPVATLKPTSLPKPTTAPSLPAATRAIAPPATPGAQPTTSVAKATVVPAAMNTAAPAALPAGLPYIVVAHGGDNPEELVNRAILALGGIEHFVKPGNDVIIKPNICVAYHTYEYAATTNPWVVAALVKLCLGAGAKRVRVMDNPFGGTADQAYAISGIGEQVKAAGGVMEQMANRKFQKTDIPQGLDIKNWMIYDEIVNADVIINVPIAKHHSLARLTLGMKNMMGTIINRESIHGRMGQRLADLTGRIKPALTVIDAVRILKANGPTGGNLNDVQKLDTLIASPDVVAADTYAASLFGVKPEQLDYIGAGVKSGIGRSDLANMKIEQITVAG
jgi:uncharacterized protein (DUF362 family)